MVPLEDDTEHNQAFSENFPEGVARGWGGVAWSAYGSFLQKMGRAQWPHSHLVKHPIYACGYDWRSDIAKSGKLLAGRIDKILSDHPRAKGVVLITHSMGGLVARAAMHMHGAASKVHGVIHAVQPVTGAPVAYWRFKAGFSRSGFFDFKPWVLGSHALDYTALVALCPGGLQLLPSKAYRDGRGRKEWLRVRSKDGGERIALPKSDPYAEIYSARTGDYWCVTPDHVAGVRSAREKDESLFWRDYLANLQKARSLHDHLDHWQHPLTYNFYSSGSNTCEEVVFEESKRPRPVDDGKRKPVLAFDRGAFWRWVDLSPGAAGQDFVKLQHESGDGDETVPTRSARHLADLAGVSERACDIVGGAHGDVFNHEGYVNAISDAVAKIVRQKLLARSTAP
jgi:pimeloyl-ACP methyl ester carboxylesterase